MLVSFWEIVQKGKKEILGFVSGGRNRTIHSEPFSFQGELLNPCRCDGSVRYTHQLCLLKWISERGSWTCELCCYRYHVTAIKMKQPCQVDTTLTPSRNNFVNTGTLDFRFCLSDPLNATQAQLMQVSPRFRICRLCLEKAMAFYLRYSKDMLTK